MTKCLECCIILLVEAMGPPCKQKGLYMKKTLAMACLTLAALAPLSAMSEVLVYKLTMKLHVPRIYDNMQSMGYRKPQLQTIKGFVYVDKGVKSGQTEPEISVAGMYNRTHRVYSKSVTYMDTDATGVMYRYIGSNKTGVFKQPCIKFSLDLDPSYNIGDDEPDNTLVIDLAGQGRSERSIKGGVTGQIGCGCRAYRHVSPTRTIVYGVNDIAPLYGTFTMTLVGSTASCR